MIIVMKRNTLELMLLWWTVIAVATFLSPCNGECTLDDYHTDVDPLAHYFAALGPTVPALLQRETPVITRSVFLTEAVGWNCIAAYNPAGSKHDALYPNQPPIVTVPETVCTDVDPYTEQARIQCYVYAYAAMIPTFLPDAAEPFQASTKAVDSSYPDPLPLGLDPEIEVCTLEEDYEDFKGCVNTVVEGGDYIPALVASALAADMFRYAKADGWNMDGSNDGECTNNCRPYADTTGYLPKNVPGASNKYKELWQPLLEDSGLGFFYRQEHVTPHIGFTGVPLLISREKLNNLKLEDPKYDYKKEAAKVVKRMAALDDKKKVEVERFDNKIWFTGLVTGAAIALSGQDDSFELRSLFTVGLVAAEYDSILLAWKEKVRHDRVRTTTVVQQRRYGTPDAVTTWGGPFRGVQTFHSSQFQPYIRVMPHAEYPSGSGCICQAGVDAVKAIMEVMFDQGISIDDPGSFPAEDTFPKGGSSVEPGLTPSMDVTLTYSSLLEIRDACGESRLDGGMHFEASVPDSYELCSGFGPSVGAYVRALDEGTSFMKDSDYDAGGRSGKKSSKGSKKGSRKFRRRY